MAGPGCASKAGAKASSSCSAAHGLKAEAGGCGFMQVLMGGSGCCPGKGESAAFQTLKVDIVETPDGYMAVASVSDAKAVEKIQKMANNGWESIVKSKGGDCGPCKEMYAFVNQGANVEIYNTTAGAIIVARAGEKKVVDGLHAYAAKIRTQASTETQG
jgi:hypothetical protein